MKSDKNSQPKAYKLKKERLVLVHRERFLDVCGMQPAINHRSRLSSTPCLVVRLSLAQIPVGYLSFHAP